MAVRDFLAWGIHCVEATFLHLPEAGMELWLKDGELSRDLRRVQALAESLGMAIQSVPVKTLDRLSDGAVHQGLVVRRRLPVPLSLSDYIDRIGSGTAAALLLVLDQIKDPQNFGACLRVADGAGADAVLVARDNTATITGTVAKAASGALDSVPIITVPNLARGLEDLRRAGMWFVGAAHDAPQSLYACDLSGPTGFIFGSEGTGMRQLTRAKCDHLVHIPMAGRLSSLNVSTAVAVGLFETTRQRQG